MFKSIKYKLTLIYIILIGVPLLIINYLSIDNMTNSILSEIEVDALKTANIVSDISRNNADEPLQLRQRVKEYVDTEEGRVLVIDRDGQVIVDSANLLEGRLIDNKEITLAFKMQEAIGYYYSNKYLVQVAVPIVEKVGDERLASGVVLVSLNVDEAFNNIQSFSRNLIMISLVAAIIAVIVAFVVSSRITKPISVLSKTARKIGDGHLGETVDIKSKDEIGRLAEDFNDMSKELYRIDQGRTQFIGNVSHELKSPLASIKALIDSLLYGEDNIETYKEFLGDIDSEIDRLTDLVNSLLDLTRIEEQGINTDTYSIGDIINEAARILKPLANKHKVSINVDIRDDINLICDKKLIEIALINLIDNGIKYRDTGKAENKVDIIARSTKEGYQIEVIDNGIGIDEGEIEAVLEKFYRTDRSRSRDTGGTGIGLSTVDRIIKLHGWKIEIHSELNEGTRVNIMVAKTS